MMSRAVPLPLFAPLRIPAGLASVLLALSGAVGAQEAAPDGPGEAALQFIAPVSSGGIEFATDGASRKPRLRMRFDAATRAVRSLGVEAEECSSMLRSSNRSRAGTEHRSLGLTLSLSCRFF